MAQRSTALLTLMLLAVAPTWAGEPDEGFDRYGGWLGQRSAATGWFRTARAKGRWWLVDPDGFAFLSIGVSAVALQPDPERGPDPHAYREAAVLRHGRPRDWAAASTERLRQWGFNTLGARCDRTTWRQGMPYTVALDFAGLVKRNGSSAFPDVFDPAYQAAANRYARRECRRLAEDPMLVGYFIDGGLRWPSDEPAPETLFVEFLGRSDAAPGRRELLGILETWYLRIDELNDAWGTAYESFDQVGRIPQVGSRIPADDVDGFLRVVAEEYFRIARDAIRAVDEHHLILGCRFAEPPPRPVLEAMRDYVDVVSLSHYGDRPPAQRLREAHRATGKPVLLTGFGLPRPGREPPGEGMPGTEARSQEDAAEWYRQYVAALVAMPMVVGYHWPEYVGGATEGVPVEEDGGYGLVDTQDVPHAPFVEAVSGVNHAAYRLAAAGR